jgi:hypothetical protein
MQWEIPVVTDGCQYGKSCFECPFPDDCQVDTISRINIIKGQRIRRNRIGKLLAEGKVARDIAREINAPLATVRRDIYEIKKGEDDKWQRDSCLA